MAAVPRVSIVIVNFNSGSLLKRCIVALQQQTVSCFEVIVVDNASTDDSIDQAQVSDDRFHVVRLNENTGFASGTNRGIALAKADWIATLNPDAFPISNWLEVVLDVIGRNPLLRIIGSTQINALNDEILDGAGDCYHVFGIPWRGGYGHSVSKIPVDGEVFGPCAAAAFYNAAVLRELGGFDESFFCYCEDVDLAFRFRLSGYRCLQLAKARVYHCGSAVTGQRSYFTQYYSARNRVWLFIKNMPLPLLLPLFPVHVLATIYLLFRLRKTEVFEPQLKGFIDAFMGLHQPLRQRQKVQRTRRTPWWRIARSFTWSLNKLRRRDPDVRSWPEPKSNEYSKGTCNQ